MEEQELQSTEQVTESSEPKSFSEALERMGSESTEQSKGPIDLDSVDKFRFQGREWTRKEAEESWMRQQDYTKKTQAVAEERKYVENLRFDLAKVKQDPSLADLFKKTYPEKFHAYLDFLELKAKEAPQENKGELQLPPELQSKLSQVDQFLKKVNDQEQAATEAKVDAIFDKLSKKYDLADQELVVSLAQSILDKNKQLPQDQQVQFTDKVWEDIFKSVQDRMTNHYNSYYSKKIKEQSAANAKGRDSASGGGVPGQAPRSPKTIKEAGEMFREQLAAME